MDTTDQLDKRTRLRRWRRALMGLCGALALVAGPASGSWSEALQLRLTALDSALEGELGVYVRDLDSGEAFSFRADEHWYLASGIKIPVAIAVMRGVEREQFRLADKIRLQPEDYVDGAGQTNYYEPGTALSIRFLLEQMLVHSDNTASDALIRLVGLDSVNEVARELVPEGFGKITTLADVRRHAYSQFHERAFELTSKDFFALRAARDERLRVELLARILELSPSELAQHDLNSAFEAYYATRLNAAPLEAYGTLLAALAEGRALQPEGTAYLLEVLGRVETGKQRIKAGLPASARFAHKTGTQHWRACDMGIATSAPEDGSRRIVIAACTRGSPALSRSERALRGVGEAVKAVGLLQPLATGDAG